MELHSLERSEEVRSSKPIGGAITEALWVVGCEEAMLLGDEVAGYLAKAEVGDEGRVGLF